MHTLQRLFRGPWQVAAAAVAAVMVITGVWWVGERGANARVVRPAGGDAAIRRAIARLGPAGGEIRLTAGEYLCSQPVIIRSSHISLRGVGSASLLKLADGANCPVLIVGDESPDPRHAVRGVCVADLAIDGNRTQQNTECWDGKCDTGGQTVLRSCGLILRRAEDARVERVSISRCRSAGLVTEKGCRRLTIQQLDCSDNHFDGLACYETEDSIFTGLQLHDNASAGISTDLKFNRNVIANTVLARNGTQGIFMRDSRYNVLQGMLITDSGRQGIFIAQADKDVSTAATDNSFIGLAIVNSEGPAIRINDESCQHNLISGCQFIDNGSGLSEATAGLATLEPTGIHTTSGGDKKSP